MKFISTNTREGQVVNFEFVHESNIYYLQGKVLSTQKPHNNYQCAHIVQITQGYIDYPCDKLVIVFEDQITEFALPELTVEEKPKDKKVIIDKTNLSCLGNFESMETGTDVFFDIIVVGDQSFTEGYLLDYYYYDYGYNKKVFVKVKTDLYLLNIEVDKLWVSK